MIAVSFHRKPGCVSDNSSEVVVTEKLFLRKNEVFMMQWSEIHGMHSPTLKLEIQEREGMDERK